MYLFRIKLKTKTMDRKEFLTSIGFGTAGVLIASCIGGCSKTAVPAAPANVNQTIKLSDYPALANIGGMIYTDGVKVGNNGIIVAKTIASTYVAVSQFCTHQGGTVQYDQGGNDFYCPRHGAIFSDTGAHVSGPGSGGLTQYTVVVNGDGTITIKSK